jgi:hypothetical protein
MKNKETKTDTRIQAHRKRERDCYVRKGDKHVHIQKERQTDKQTVTYTDRNTKININTQSLIHTQTHIQRETELYID